MKPEQQIQKSILEYLAVEKIWHIRMNSGAVVSEYKGKSRMFQFGRKGCADILAIVRGGDYAAPSKWVREAWDEASSMPSHFISFGSPFSFTPLWLEVKAPKGKQSESQHDFQKEVEAQGHRYAIVQSIEDVQDAVKAL